jgi:PAS domain S-box-containing protein
VLSASLALVAAVALPWVMPADAGAGRDGRTAILLLYAEARPLPAVVDLDREIRSTFQAALPGGVEFFTESLDLAWFPDEGYRSALPGFLRQKYAGRRLDLVISAGGQALRFALAHRDQLFPGVPIVFAAVDRATAAGLEVGPGVTGVWMVLDWEGTLDTALRLQPGTRRVVVIAGTSELERAWLADGRQALRKYEGRVELTYLSDRSMTDLLREVAALPGDTIVLLVAMLRDATGASFIGVEALALMHKVSPVPIYGLFDLGVGRGLVGGRVASFGEQGRRAAQLGLRVLGGDKAGDVPAVREAANVYLFDWRELRRWGLSEDHLPPGSVVQHRQPSAWELYRWWIVGGLTLTAAEAALIIALLVQRRTRKRVQRSLQETEERFRLMADSAPVMVWMSGSNARCTYFNRPWLDFTGRRLEEEVGDGWIEGVHPDDRTACLEAYGKAFDAREAFTLEYRLRRVDGAYRWVLDHGVPRFGPDRSFQGYIGSAIDVTERRVADEIARRQRDELAHALRVTAMGELAASLAHEINQPLFAIMSNAEAARRLLAAPSVDVAEVGEALRDIGEDGRRAADVIARLRAFFAKEPAERQPVDVNELATGLAGLVRREVEHRGISLTLAPTPGLPAVLGDPVQIQQVVLNLLLNACEAMEGDGPRILTIGTSKDGAGTVEISVGDTGAGLGTMDFAGVFEPFVTTKPGGLGMGLSISRSIIESHGGRIWLTPNPDRGITAHVALLIAETDA